jgi:hypothetical protein
VEILFENELDGTHGEALIAGVNENGSGFGGVGKKVSFEGF